MKNLIKSIIDRIRRKPLLVKPVVIKNGKLHTCQYCGAETTQPDEVCYAAPKVVAVCENCRFNNPKNYHDQMWCRDCQQKNHFEQTVC